MFIVLCCSLCFYGLECFLSAAAAAATIPVHVLRITPFFYLPLLNADALPGCWRLCSAAIWLDVKILAGVGRDDVGAA